VLELLKTELGSLWQMMLAVVEADAALKQNTALLISIPGIAQISAVMLLAELPPLDAFESARQLCAFAGLSPRQHQSGDTVKKRTRLCKQGRTSLRTLLFMPAMSLLSSKSGPMRVFADRLLKAGKAAKCVVGALMRKLLALVFAILRSGKPFAPNYRPAQPIGNA
jgi:transposase